MFLTNWNEILTLQRSACFVESDFLKLIIVNEAVCSLLPERHKFCCRSPHANLKRHYNAHAGSEAQDISLKAALVDYDGI